MDAPAAISRARDGDEEAFRSLYRSVQPGLLRYLRVLVGEHAEDVASEAWLQVVRDLGSFRGDDDAFRGWAVTIARNRALDHLRRMRRQPVVETEPAHLPERPSGDDAATLAFESISTDAALALIARLPHDQAEAVLLRTVVGLDATAAGKVLGKRPGAVRTAAHRGLRRLAELLGEESAEHADEGVPNKGAPNKGAPNKGATNKGVTKRPVWTLTEVR